MRSRTVYSEHGCAVLVDRAITTEYDVHLGDCPIVQYTSALEQAKMSIVELSNTRTLYVHY